jgi:hypothetical protein
VPSLHARPPSVPPRRRWNFDANESEFLKSRLVGAFLCSAVALAGTRALGDTLTYHGDTYRTGWNSHETTLTTANASALERKFTAPVDGLIFTQPLVASNVKLASGPKRSLAVVGTNNDSLYAFDAQSGATIWKTSFAVDGATPVPISYTGCDNVGQEDGILSTPVIDRSSGTLYVVAATLEGASGAQHIHHRLHALALATGIDRMAPADIGGSFTGPSGSSTFDGDFQFQRPALLEANGQIYVGFGGQCDEHANDYHGWVFAYSVSTLQRDALIDITPTADNNGDYFGGIWMTGGGLSADAAGNVYFVVGNGTFDGTANFGQSALRLPPNLTLSDFSFFTPYTVFIDNDGDSDFGTGALMLLPDAPNGSGPHLAVAQGKDGIFTLLDRDKLGGYVAGGPDNALQELSLGGVWASPGSFRDASGHDYVLTTGGPLYSVKITGTTAAVVGETKLSFPSDNGNGSTPSISSNGTKAGTAIAWIVRNPANVSTDHLELYAYDASNLSRQLFAAPLGMWPQSDLNPTLFPTIAAGRVYVPSASALVAYGLKSGGASSPGVSVTRAAVERVPSTEVAPAAFPAFGPHVLHAIVERIATRSLEVRLRDGNAIAVDITQARAAGRTGVLYVNRPVALYGAYDAKHVYRVNAINSANSLRNGAPWPVDR